ncbi:enoyl-CoA delta isomerase 1, mitochondrial isoform X2 [Drosophila miranda]|uniref:enoyl-CoA delta isomerase 1, mitochondrial isoform X2 n=1 Tax=Drosophila miranda TaxID=7229 RepID=UPI00143F6F18|nr:enoyl-CoA delta isomerase 1, mitochondrial isoform X2 [Drosophila miranda]
MLRNSLIGSLRQIKPILCSQSLRSLSNGANSGLTTIEVDDKSGIATLSMNLPPVNTLTLNLMHDLIDSINQIECNKSRGLILTSSNDKVFSAGLDLKELYKPDQERLKEFWTIFQDLWLALHLCGIPTAAAINGHAPAAGCIMATACEYRVMLPDFVIGVHELSSGR